MGLSSAGHEEKAAVFEGDGDFFAASFVAKVEAAFGTEAEGGDSGVGAEFFFVVLMPTHALFAFLVKIGEAGVEGGVGEFFDLFFDLGEFSRPGEGLVGFS